MALSGWYQPQRRDVLNIKQNRLRLASLSKTEHLKAYGATPGSLPRQRQENAWAFAEARFEPNGRAVGISASLSVGRHPQLGQHWAKIVTWKPIYPMKYSWTIAKIIVSVFRMLFHISQIPLIYSAIVNYRIYRVHNICRLKIKDKTPKTITQFPTCVLRLQQPVRFAKRSGRRNKWVNNISFKY